MFAPPDHSEVDIKPEELREWQKSVPLWPVEVVRSFNSALLILGASALSQFRAQTQSEPGLSHLPHPHHCHRPQVACTGTRQILTLFTPIFDIAETVNEVESWNSASSYFSFKLVCLLNVNTLSSFHMPLC